MANSNANIRYEFQDNFLGGANSAYDALKIGSAQYAWGRNIVVRGSSPRVRPRFILQCELPVGRIQGAEIFQTSSGNTIIAAIQGRLYQFFIQNDEITYEDITPREEVTSTQADYVQPIVGSTVEIQVISTYPIQKGERFFIQGGGTYVAVQSIDNTTFEAQNLGGPDSAATGATVTSGAKVSLEARLNPDAPYYYFCQAFDTMVIQDGTSRPALFSGGRARKSVGSEVPAGQFMAFGNGRLWVSKGREILAGDLFGVTPDSHLLFTETDYLAEGGSFVMPEEITGMAFLPRIDNATEFGDLVIFTRNTTNTIQAQVYDRTLWKQTRGMQRLLFPKIGCVSHNSIVPVNQDLYFRSLDGIRSIRNTISDLQDFGNTPVSTEVRRIVDYDTDRWYPQICGTFFDNRLLMTANLSTLIGESEYEFDNVPFNIIPRSIVSLDFAPMSAMGQESPPAYDGDWTGINPVSIVTGAFSYGDRCFAFCAQENGNFLVEITREFGFDENLLTEKRYRIPAFVEMKKFAWKNPFDTKELYGAKVFFCDIKGDLFWELGYKPDEYGCYTFWQKGRNSAPVELCSAEDSCSIPNLHDGYTADGEDLKAPPQNVCNEYASRKMFSGNTFQIRVNMTGSGTLNRIRVASVIKDPNEYGRCTTDA